MSTTNIRYLDNQRYMADELFDGNMASKIALGEAIICGILNALTYVLLVFAYQQDYERLKSRVRRAKSKAVRDEADKYYDEYGDLNMPADYKPDGIWLAKWLNEQRQIYIGKRKGKSLTDEQIRRLNEIGMQ